MNLVGIVDGAVEYVGENCGSDTDQGREKQCENRIQFEIREDGSEGRAGRVGEPNRAILETRVDAGFLDFVDQFLVQALVGISLPLERPVFERTPVDVIKLRFDFGDSGLQHLGKKDWQRETVDAIKQLKRAVIADYVVLGGGNAKIIEELPDGFELGSNRNAYPGGVRLWETDPETKRPRWRIM